ncbi:phosphonate metabolism protein/1,5-bisphosphokinase (PRPP-forming) PhnN [uncultured Bilophila sp.]|uniref:phosphonate metabolism protein/1,5-bisphosphokinase (PRPP-forming) PhnN n=1 Tax=uncultured Bilophila sp. TaxID=529385 RepID=UPI00280BD0A4|nr:phosphonate metabolism protein/1,5-bisphosphokinase (PRPP-forming) PhnN [uncultured Bilophila sp.]
MRQGRLVYVMGASGAGKDSLLQLLRLRLRGVPAVFARRYITRPLSVRGERHIAVSPERFADMAASGQFVMDWRSHGLRYGIGRGVETTLGRGHVVLVNGSREYLPEALRRYPDLVPVLVEGDASVLRARLLARGGERGADIEERIARASIRAEYPAGVRRIDNSGPIAESVEALHRLVMQLV